MPYIFVNTVKQLNKLIGLILYYDFRGKLYCDIESTGLDWFTDEILLFQIKVGEEIYIVDVRELGYDKFKELIESIYHSDCTVVFHNAKFDMKFIYYRTNILLNNIYDTMICEALLNAGIGKPLYSLEELSEQYAGIFMEKTSRKEFINFPKDRPFTETLLNYSALDVKVLPDIMSGQTKRVIESNMEKVVELEMKLIPVLVHMEFTGIRLDTEKWLRIEKEAIEKRQNLENQFKEELVSRILKKKFNNGFELATALKIPVHTKKLSKTLEEITDTDNIKSWVISTFNINSPLQLKTSFHLVGIKVPDTNEKTLFNFLKHDLVTRLVELRGLGKQISSYGTNYLRYIHPLTNKIHTEFFQTGTVTGRMSSGDPNVQQVPRVGGYRECFIPSDGYVYLGIDYNQQEYRLTGAISGEPVIINSYKNGYDMHIATAAMLFNKKVEEVTKEERQTGKNTNFALIYGSSEYGLSRNFKITVEKAKEIIDTFWSGYKRLSAFKKMVETEIIKRGFSSTLLGRRRYNIAKPEMMDSKQFMSWKGRVLREGFNVLIQGGCADIMKQAMINIYERNPFGDKFRLLIQVHDELLAEAEESIKEEAYAFMKKEMEDVLQEALGEIPAVSEGKIMNCWTK